jgi:hypothetical protein
MVSRNVSNAFTVADRSVQLHKGTILDETQLKDCVFLFLRIRVIPGIF